MAVASKDREINLNFGENLKKILNSKNMSQSDLSKMLGVTRQTVSLWTNNKILPSYEKMLELSSVLDISFGELADPFGNSSYISIGREIYNRKPLLDLYKILANKDDEDIRSLVHLLS